MILGIAQINPTAGDFSGNIEKILNAYHEASNKGADLVVTPELSLFGYPLGDLVLKKSFIQDGEAALEKVIEQVGEVGLLVGCVFENELESSNKEIRKYRNTAVLIQNGEIIGKVHKTLLPNYDIYDQQYYFEPSEKCEPLRFNGHKIGITIGEDIWIDDLLERPNHNRDPASELKAKRAQIIINMSASHFQVGKPQYKANILEVIACGTGVPICCCNAVGGNDHFIFDGHSMVIDPHGNALIQFPGFSEVVEICDVTFDGEHPPIIEGKSIEHIYNALVLGIRDYAHKIGYEKVVIGLSGGIDSAVTLALATEALGAENIKVLTMPSKFSSEESLADAVKLAATLGVDCESIAIKKSHDLVYESLEKLIGTQTEGRTDENIQSRIRNLFLMAVANKNDYLVLSTINKTDMFTGNYTIYGDSVTGLCVLGDVPKKIVYLLAKFINSKTEVILKSIIEREPSPELAESQSDLNQVPSYKVVDSIIDYYVIYSLSASEIVSEFRLNAKDVYWVQKQIDLNAWKRLQSPPVLRVTSPAYGRGRKIPITQKYITNTNL